MGPTMYVNVWIQKCIYEAAIILIRNPFHALVAEFNRQMTSKTGFVEPQLFSSMGWDDFINEYRNDRQSILTLQAQSSERNLPGTIVPWRDNFDKW